MKNPQNMTLEELQLLQQVVNKLIKEKKESLKQTKYNYAFDRNLLTEHQREVLKLRKEGLTYSEIAKRFNTTTSSVIGLHHKAMMNDARMFIVNRLKNGCITDDMDITHLGLHERLIGRIKYQFGDPKDDYYLPISRLSKISDEELLKIKNVGQKTLSEIRRAISYVKEKEN